MDIDEDIYWPGVYEELTPIALERLKQLLNEGDEDIEPETLVALAISKGLSRLVSERKFLLKKKAKAYRPLVLVIPEEPADGAAKRPYKTRGQGRRTKPKDG